ncbi:MAG: Ig-like domain-containing domain [Ferruginibacter sp.]
MNFRINFFLIILCGFLISILVNGCAQIGTPTGGIRDSLAPMLVRATPAQRTTNFTGNKITLTFNEYIELKDVPNNLFISPVQKINPVISYNLRTISVKFRDTLLPNTTYAVNFGNAIVDLNEGNILRDYSYLFSTGNNIDSMRWSGKVVMAETGQVDSTIIAMLYRRADDSSVQKRKPDYIARLKGDGSFTFRNLPAGSYKVYALKDGDNGKTYNSKTEAFAFLNKEINITDTTSAETLYAYVQEKASPPKVPLFNQATDKRLRFTSSATEAAQDILAPLEITFNRAIKNYDTTKIILTDTLFNPITGQHLSLDSTRKILSIYPTWAQGTAYRLLIAKDAVTDTTNTKLNRSDTIKFSTKKTTDYGSLLLRFKNLDLSRHPVIQFLSGEIIKFSYPVTGAEWSQKLFLPGEYSTRILFDTNQNGKWDPGNYSLKLQPEKAFTLPQKLSIKADWENERDISIDF